MQLGTFAIGMHTLWVAADFRNQISENDETNNWSSISFNVVAPTPLNPKFYLFSSFADTVAEMSSSNSFDWDLASKPTGLTGDATLTFSDAGKISLLRDYMASAFVTSGHEIGAVSSSAIQPALQSSTTLISVPKHV
jgi:hypothetical protein